jgi:hypothetical protein
VSDATGRIETLFDANRSLATGVFELSRRNLAFDDHCDRRVADRIEVGLPASILVGSQRHSAKLVNITRHGAMLEMSLPLLARSRVLVKCGAISVEAKVIWNRGNLLGVTFKSPITEAQVREQISRCAALKALRDREDRC